MAEDLVEHTKNLLMGGKAETKEYTNKFLDTEEIRLKARYATLSELWIPKSKHATQIQIGRLMDEALEKFKRIDELRKLVKETLG